MGKSIDRTRFGTGDFKAFERKLHCCLSALETVLDNPEFGCGDASIGAELELYLLDADELPFPHNNVIQKQFRDPQLTLELNRYNLEYNLSPVPAQGKPFAALEQQMLAVLRKLQTLTAKKGGHVLPIGILPTLGPDDFGQQVMTDEPRYHVLANALNEIRDHAFGINIDGDDAVRLKSGDVTLEGACTSFQLHYRMDDPSRFSALWNSIQLVTPLVLGVAANSPMLMGHRLWHETRVPLFKQSVDGRDAIGHEWREPGRVCFGHGWLVNGPISLFREMVNLYRPLIPVRTDEDPIAVIKKSGIPKLEELCLHDGTIWSWNRPIYDPEDDPHLRIEMRALPAGPTPLDMVANAALFIGLAEGLSEQIEPLLSALPFSYAEYNFYRAAQYGMDAQLLWPYPDQNGLRETPLVEVVQELLPLASQGLIAIGVEETEVQRLLGVIEERLACRCNGATWQLSQYTTLLSRNLSGQEACQALVAAYREQATSNTPVAQWSHV